MWGVRTPAAESTGTQPGTKSVGSACSQTDLVPRSALSERGTNGTAIILRVPQSASGRITLAGSQADGGHKEGPHVKAQATKTISIQLPFEVVRDQIPTDMLARLLRDFSPAEVDQIEISCGRTLAPAVDQPSALFVLGPSAVGKTYLTDATAAQLFGSAQNAVVIDGDIFREWHQGWCEVVRHGVRRHVLHEDAWVKFKKVQTTVSEGSGSEDGASCALGISTALKQRILNGAVASRQNLIIPSCANQPEKLTAELEHLAAAGYKLHAVCLWAPLSATQRRGEPRSVREGKRWDGKDYDISVRTVLGLAQRWVTATQEAASSTPYRSIALWDNTIFPAREVDLEEFETLSQLSHAAADQHAWQLQRPTHGLTTWGKLRTVHTFGSLLKPRFVAMGTQTAEMAEEAMGASHPSNGSKLRAQRRKGRLEGGLLCCVVLTIVWGGTCLALLLLYLDEASR